MRVCRISLFLYSLIFDYLCNMSNEYFQFKRFLVKQSSSGMKVGTDSCLLGSWVDVKNCRRVLDIGTGTGILALMCAQRLESMTLDFEINAVDIEPSAVLQARENVLSSPWAEHIHVICMDILNYQSLDKYDLIVCNPPYFEDSLKSVGEQRTLARHNISLNFSDLINKVSNLISHEGNFCVVLPILGAAHFIQLAVEQGFYLNSRTDVQTVERKSPKRVLLSFSKKENPNPKFDKLVIQREGQYTQDFQDLTRDFYLNF